MQAEKRYQVFVSSTYLDLREERQAVVSALLNVDAFPSGMELFPATDDDAWTLIRDVIEECDYYLLIIGGKYGSVDEDLKISFTEREFDAAVELGKPVMAFVHRDPGTLTANRIELKDDAREKLEAFRKKVKDTKHVAYWDSADDLAGKVALTWNKFIKRYPAVGWIRADQATSMESLERIAKADREIEQLKAQLEQSRTEAPGGAAGLAQGEDVFEFHVQPRFQFDAPGYPEKWARASENVRFTWNSLFRRLGLALMTESSEEQLAVELSEFLLDEKVSHVAEDWIRRVKDTGAKRFNIPPARVRVQKSELAIPSDLVRSIILQFDALGLATQSTKKRSVSDKATYWTLTPYGRTRLVQVRALRSGELPEVAEGDQGSVNPEEVVV